MAKGALRVLLVLAMAAGLLAAAGLPADAAKRNESRWFLQNVCLANATKILGKTDWKSYQKEAKAARKRLKSRGVPEAHLREMEDFATRVIRTTTTEQNKAKAPQLCMQWYST